MTDIPTSSAESYRENSPSMGTSGERPPSQRPSFTRGNDPIARLPFIVHWLLSLLLLVATPVGTLHLIEAAGIYGMFVPLLLIAILPGTVLYWTSARRRLADLRMNMGWSLLIIPFVAASVLNGYDGAMGIPAQSTIPQPIGSLLLLPAVILHIVLMVRRGRRVVIEVK